MKRPTLPEVKTDFKLDEITAYRVSFELSNYIWKIVSKWESFERRNLGAPFLSAVDSISAHIARGFGGTERKEKIDHYRISYGFMYEAIDWNQKARVRKLLEEKDYTYIYKKLHSLPKAIQALIDFTERSTKAQS